MLVKGKDDYNWFDNEYNQCFVSNVGFTQLFAVSPSTISSYEYDKAEKRLKIIHDFQDRCISLFRKALFDSDTQLLHWLLNETPKGFRAEYHKNLKDYHYTKPVFFRTDEMSLGKIAEIQCPGSLWGELEILYHFYKSKGFDVNAHSPATEFALQLKQYLGKEPVIHYLVDNASIPAGIRYFIQQTRPYLQYWGIDKGIKQLDCNFIRTHSFFGLCGENYFNQRLMLPAEKIKYDYPPHVLLDQKATLVLPFWNKTRKYFSDAIRDILIFSAPVCDGKLQMENGEELTFEEFSALPQSKRCYYLKYAGTNTSINWGSRAVERLSNLGSQKCLQLLKRCQLDYYRGKIWLIQKEVNEKNIVIYRERDGEEKEEKLNSKFSFFYGPVNLVGIVGTYSKKHKVHGQSDSVINILYK